MLVQLPVRLVAPIPCQSRNALPDQPSWHRSFVLAAVVLTSLWAAACGDGATGPAPAPTTPNRAPVPSGSIPAQTVGVGESVMLNVAAYFNDPDGGALTYTAASSNTATASATVAGSVVTVTGVAQGMASVTVTARDPGGMSAQQTMTVTVPQSGADGSRHDSRANRHRWRDRPRGLVSVLR